MGIGGGAKVGTGRRGGGMEVRLKVTRTDVRDARLRSEPECVELESLDKRLECLERRLFAVSLELRLSPLRLPPKGGLDGEGTIGGSGFSKSSESRPLPLVLVDDISSNGN
jgi:hypothetical protein